MIHLPQDLKSKYRFITLAAQRCEQLIRGARPRIESRSVKPTTIAQEEVLAGVIEERAAEPIDLGPLLTPADEPGEMPTLEPVPMRAEAVGLVEE